MLAAIRQTHPTIPIGLLMYANLVFSPGIDAFYAQCARVGVDSVLVADVPVEESAPFRQAAMRHNIAPIFICPPNADDDLLRQIASYGRGYTYLLSRAGVTGAENRAALPLHHLVEKLAEYHAAPPLQGFGISAPEQVSAAIDAGAAGAISGSAIVNDDTLYTYYTGHRWRNGVNEDEGNLQVQMMATSKDGITFDDKKMIVDSPEGLLHFRDPNAPKPADPTITKLKDALGVSLTTK